MDSIQIQILDWSVNVEGGAFDSTFDFTFRGGTQNGIVLDVFNDGKFPFSLTSSIADIADINDRSGSFSIPFEVLSTKENDRYLDHLYYSSQKNYKDFDDKKEAKIIINGIDIDKGTVRIERIAAKNNDRKYNFTFYGNNLDWVLQLQGKTFQSLAYLDQDLTYDEASIAATWTNTAGDYLPLYSYLKRGNRKSALQMSVIDFLPDYYMYDVFHEAFKSIGYSVESTWLETASIKKLTTPFFGTNFVINQETIEGNSTQAATNNSISNIIKPITSSDFGTYELDASYSSAGVKLGECGWNILSGNADFVFDTTTGLYKTAFNGYYRFNATIDHYFTTDTTSTVTGFPVWKLQLTDATTGGFVGNYTIGVTSGTAAVETIVGSKKTRRQGYVLTPHTLYVPQNTNIQFLRNFQINNYFAHIGEEAEVGIDYAMVKVDLLDSIQEGYTYNWQEVSDNDKSLLEYITDVAKIHNLYFRTNTATKKVYIEKRDDFYNPLTTAENWTDRIYQDRQYELRYNSSAYNRNQFFGYVKDSDDKFLDIKTKDLSEEWMAYTHEYPAKFKEGTRELKTKIIAASLPYQDEFGVICTHMISSEDGNATSSSNFNPRLLYYNYGTQVSSDLSTDTSWTFEGTTYPNIPYSLPFDYYQKNVVRANVDGNLSFKDIDNVNGRFIDYYAKTSKEIEDGLTLSISMLFDFVDYRNLDFRVPIYFDNRYPDIEGYWYIQKIENFSNDVATDFELIKAKNYINQTLNPRFVATDVVPDGSTGNETNKLTSINSPDIREVLGFRNVADGGSVVVGDGLTASSNNVRLGVNNLDVSTDIFQLGTGASGNPFSLIRVDENGVVYFNGTQLPKSNSEQTKTASFTAEEGVCLYILDTTLNDITVTLPDVTVGTCWNFKWLINNGNTVYITTENSTVDTFDTVQIKTLLDCITIQMTENNGFLII